MRSHNPASVGTVAAEIARAAGVTRGTVLTWRRRHAEAARTAVPGISVQCGPGIADPPVLEGLNVDESSAAKFLPETELPQEIDTSRAHPARIYDYALTSPPTCEIRRA
jgi:hypothetical protein